MIVEISSDAENDLVDGFWFYERQSPGLGDYFRSCLISDIDSLKYYAGVHEKEYRYHRALSKRFPFGIYYSCDSGHSMGGYHSKSLGKSRKTSE